MGLVCGFGVEYIREVPDPSDSLEENRHAANCFPAHPPSLAFVQRLLKE